MDFERRKSKPACRAIRELETYLGAPVVCVVVFHQPREFSFVFPAESDDAYIAEAMGAIGKACQNASKSL